LTPDGTAQPDGHATGLRTFLIADIRGYTTFTREKGDEAAAELAATFAATVREVIKERDGYLLELRGDEALVVFESPRQALRGAVALQQKFAEVGLPRGVGIGLDAGEAIPVEGGYRGGALNLAARLCSQAGPGEILASEAVIHLAAHIDGVEYIDARTLHLKGYTAPIRAIEVAAPGRRRKALSRRVRRAQAFFRMHRRLIAMGAVTFAVGVLGVLVVARPAAKQARIPTLADLPSGIALVDVKTGKETTHVGNATVKQPVDGAYVAGTFWVLNLEPLSFVQVDPKTGSIIRQVSSPFPDLGGFAGDEQNFWIADYAHPVIARFDAASGRELDRLDLSKSIKPADDGFAAMTFGDGSLWLAGKDRNQVFRVNPETGALQATIDPVNSWSAAFGNGFVWTGSFGGLSRIDPSSNTASRTDVPPGHVTAGGIAVGAGFVWTADESKGVVYKVDRNGKVAETYPTGAGARTVSFSDGRLWVANQDTGTVSSIDAITGKVSTLTFGHPVESVTAGGGKVLVNLDPGRSYEDRINALTGKVARFFVAGYQYDPPEPATTWTPEALLVGDATCAKLARWVRDAKGDLRLEPEVAAAMPTISTDGRTYTFQISSGFAFSDASAEKVTAETFRHSIERALSPKLGDSTPGLLFLSDIVGVQAYRDGSADHISGLVAKGDRLIITLGKPIGDLTARLALPFFCPLPVKTPPVAGGALRRVNGPDGARDSLPSAGPYYVADHLNGEYLILQKNPNFGGRRKAKFDAIALREGISAGAAVEGVDSGKWDGVTELYDEIFSPRGELASRWGPKSQGAASGDQRYRVVTDGGVWLLALNASRAPLSDLRARQAVSLAIDRARVADLATADFYQVLPWDRLLGPDMLGTPAPSADELRPNQARARQLLRGIVQRPVKMAVPTSCDCKDAAERIARDLRVVGLQVDIQEVNEGEGSEPYAEFDMTLVAVWPDTPDRGAFLGQLLSVAIPPGWLPKPLDAFDATIAGLSGQGRDARVTQLAADAAAQFPAAVYGYSIHGAYVRKSIGCVDFWPNGELDLAAICPGS
jgi:class 3 adenylate cyclase/ABC-type oligopeptide transport system substrate-binding subunit/streptogramin lyase